MPLSSGQTVAETFGQYLLLLGPVVNTSWNRHLLGEAPDAEAGPQQQIVILSRGADAGGRPEASQYWNGGKPGLKPLKTEILGGVCGELD